MLDIITQERIMKLHAHAALASVFITEAHNCEKENKFVEAAKCYTVAISHVDKSYFDMSLVSKKLTSIKKTLDRIVEPDQEETPELIRIREEYWNDWKYLAPEVQKLGEKLCSVLEECCRNIIATILVYASERTLKELKYYTQMYALAQKKDFSAVSQFFMNTVEAEVKAKKDFAKGRFGDYVDMYHLEVFDNVPLLKKNPPKPDSSSQSKS
jgi:hypothetical protein